MKLGAFFLISALLHALIFFLPFSPSNNNKGDGHAIPVILRIAKGDAIQRSTLQAKLMNPKRSAKHAVHEHQKAAQENPKSSKERRLRVAEKQTDAVAQLKIRRPQKQLTTKEKPVKKLLQVASTTADLSATRKLSKTKKNRIKKQSPKEKIKAVLVKQSTRAVSSVDAVTGKWADDEAEILEADEPVWAVARLEIPDRPKEESDEEDHALSELGKVYSFEVEDHRVLTVEVRTVKEGEPEIRNAKGQRNKDGSTDFTRANYAHTVSPEYPERARREGWEGMTLLRVLVNPQGKSKTIQVSQSSGFALLDGAAVKAVEQWRFYPAQNGNGPVESWVRVPILFRLVRDKN
ncbi:MAG: energy transducer TonB [Candidatus Binatia bacterium]